MDEHFFTMSALSVRPGDNPAVSRQTSYNIMSSFADPRHSQLFSLPFTDRLGKDYHQATQSAFIPKLSQKPQVQYVRSFIHSHWPHSASVGSQPKIKRSVNTRSKYANVYSFFNLPFV